MKKFCLLFFCIIGFHFCSAQDTLKKGRNLKFGFGAYSNFTQYSRDNNAVVFALCLQYKRWELNGGPKIFLDRINGPDGSWVTYKGYSINASFRFRKNTAKLKPYCFAQLDYMTSTYNGTVMDYFPKDYLPFDSTLTKMYQQYQDKIYCFNFGAGLRYSPIEKLFIFFQVGAGIYFYEKRDLRYNNIFHTK